MVISLSKEGDNNEQMYKIVLCKGMSLIILSHNHSSGIIFWVPNDIVYETVILP